MASIPGGLSVIRFRASPTNKNQEILLSFPLKNPNRFLVLEIFNFGQEFTASFFITLERDSSDRYCVFLLLPPFLPTIKPFFYYLITIDCRIQAFWKDVVY